MGVRRDSLSASNEESTWKRLRKAATWVFLFLGLPFLIGAFVVSPIWSALNGDKASSNAAPAAAQANNTTPAPAPVTPAVQPAPAPAPAALQTPQTPPNSDPEIRLSTDAPTTQASDTPDSTTTTKHSRNRRHRTEETAADNQNSTPAGDDTGVSAMPPGDEATVVNEKPTRKTTKSHRRVKKTRATNPDETGAPVQSGDTIQ